MQTAVKNLIIRHEGEAPSERSTCGWRRLLISRQDRDASVAAWAHAVDIDGAREHYHRVATELYYVLSGGGTITVKWHRICSGFLLSPKYAIGAGMESVYLSMAEANRAGMFARPTRSR